jgi:KaiC/GvpD/RAD55 family RecA-like ATPase
MPRDKSLLQAADLRRLPNELEQFLSRDAYSLVVKGKAGTGKTALALTILSKSLEKQSCLYISSRLAISELFEYYPWVQNFVTSGAQAMKEGRASADGETIEVAPFVDARLDEPQSLFERITNQLMDASSPLIVIDTWDAVGDFMDKEALMTNAKILQIWRQRARAKLIFVLESVEDIVFDNLVDGVIELEEGYTNSRRTRRIRLSKLRGVKIERPYSFFTLNRGVFQSFDPFDQLFWTDATITSINNSMADMPISAGNGAASSSGQEVEDLLNGKIPKHAIVDIELDPTVSSKVIMPFLARMLAGYSKKNESFVTLLPPIGVTPEYVDLVLKVFIPNSRQRKRIEVENLPSSNAENGGANPSVEIGKIVARNRRKEKNPEILGVVTVAPFFESDGMPMSELNGFVEAVISGFDSAVIVSRSSQKSYKVSEIADVRFKIIELEGNLFLQPENPWASLYAIQNEKDGEIISVRPMV